MSLITTNDKSFELQTGETLLEALERTGHDVAYQCRSGYCGACRLKLMSGEVRYTEAPLAFVRSDEILPCCCQVLSDVTVDADLRADRLDINQDLFEPRLFDE